MIPKRIHYCWFGPGEKSDLNKRCLETWSEFLKNYEWIEWNEHNSPMDLKYLAEAYNNNLWSRISNYVRLYALYQEGGIYLDLDIEMLKPLDKMLDNECFVGFQMKKKSKDWVNNAILGSVPKHSFVKSCMDLTLRYWEDYHIYLRSPVTTTRVLRKMGLYKYGEQNLKGVKIYPIEYFYPFTWRDEFKHELISPDTVCIHHWENTWGEDFRKFKNQNIFRRIRELYYG